jgi:hypothetical protein
VTGRRNLFCGGVVPRTTIAILLSTVIQACATAGGARTDGSSANEPPAGPAIGTYEIAASIPGQHVKGTLQITADSMWFRSESNCESRYSPAAFMDVAMAQATKNVVGQDRIRFGCDGAMLSFDRRNPIQGAQWASTIVVPRQRQVCANYVMRNGQRVCERTTTETYETRETRTGPIQVHRIP